MTATPDRAPSLFPRSGDGARTTAPARPEEGTGRAGATHPATPAIGGVDVAGQTRGPSAPTSTAPVPALQAEGPRRRVLGLDLSITATGVAPWNGDPYTIGGPAVHGDRRLIRIAQVVHREAVTVDWAVIEDLPTHAYGSGITGMVHGVVRTVLLQTDIAYALVPPAVLKKYATGRGNATKADMRMALYQRTGLDIRDDNQVDAWWLRCMGLDHLGHPPITVPKTQRAALDTVTWPEVTPCP